MSFRIAVLTSSRADYGIYQPLLRKLQADKYFELELIVFGTHLSVKHGYTVNLIEDDGYKIAHRIETVLALDSPLGIAQSMALCSAKFAELWATNEHHYDLVLCLGDRYEMFAAVSAAVPFNRIKFAHLHGGETTLGAIDDKFRHCLSLFSVLHFVSTEPYLQRVRSIVGADAKVYNVGALSLDNIKEVPLFSPSVFQQKFSIDLTLPTVLVTFHPETVAYDKNVGYVNELIAALATLNEQILITMPNSDTMGNVLREAYIDFASRKSNVILVENFGIQGYFTCIKYAKYLLGNSSSGIVEAASFGKYVINVGDRQKGRACSENIIHVPADKKKIIEACLKIDFLGNFNGLNIYHHHSNTADLIINTIKNARL